MNTKAIGFFDSGVGGISIWKAVQALLPFENTIYLADSKNAPYGSQSQERIIELSIKNTDKLIDLGVKIIIVACNTATTNAIEVLRARYKIPFIGIEPAIKPAILKSKNKNIGVLATKGTLSSTFFSDKTERISEDINLTEVIGQGLVTLIEANKIDSNEMEDLLKTYLQPMLKANIDYLVLGCTHYSALIPKIKTLLPPHISIIDSANAVAQQTQNILQEQGLNRAKNTLPSYHFLTNSSTETISTFIKNYPKASIEFLNF